MKKFYTSVLSFFAMIVIANAQGNIIPVGSPIALPHVITKGVVPFATDTLWPPSFTPSPLMCDTSLVYYKLSPPNTGYAFGNNSIGETECAQKYSATGTLSKVIVLYGKKVGATGTTAAKIYSINGTTKAPLTALGTSAVVTIATMPATGFVDYNFTPSVTLAGGFAASVVFPVTPGDSVAVASTEIGCATTDSLSWLNIGGTWTSITDAFGANAELCIFPIANTSSDVAEYPSSMGLTLLGASPSPATEQTTIKYSLDHNSKVFIMIFDQTGRIVMKSTEEAISGTHKFNVNVKELSAGAYYYSIRTSETMLTSQFSVVK